MAFETTGAVGLTVKAMGVKGGLGALGAVLLYLALPPGRPVKDGAELDPVKHTKEAAREFVLRFAFAIVCSILLGDWLVDVIQGIAPWLLAAKHPHPFYVAAGAPGWWVTRAVALWFYKRQDKDIAELAHDAKTLKDEVRA